MVDNYNIQVLERAVNVIEVMKGHPYGISLKDLTEEAGLNKATIFRILATLISLGYVSQDKLSGKYMLAYKFLELAEAVTQRFDVRRVARPHLEKLSTLTGEVVHLVIRDGEEGIYIDKVDNSSGTIRMYSKVGAHTYLHSSGVGKALLAYLPQEELLRIVEVKGLPKFTENTITTIEGLMEEMKKIRKQGFSVDEIENEEGVRCVAAPIFNYNGEVVAAVSVAGPTMKVTKERLPELVYILKDITEKISREFGYMNQKAY